MGEIIKKVKFWWAWQFDKEEEWLNEMAEQGYTLVRAKWIFYWFEKTEPGEYIIRLEYQSNDPGYVSFMKEMGAERVSYHMGWNFFRRKSNLGEFNLFSDLKSKIAHLKRIEQLLLPLEIMNVGIGIMNSINVPHIGYLNLLLACLICYGHGCVKTKREILEKEKRLHE